VIDASDHARLQAAQEELLEVLEDDTMKGVPCLILANKQDRPGALGVNEMAARLNLREIHGRPWHIKVRMNVLRGCSNEHPDADALCPG
jgi:signal recognition particle receptor subunit beta